MDTDEHGWCHVMGGVVVSAAYLLRKSLLSMQVVEALSTEVDGAG